MNPTTPVGQTNSFFGQKVSKPGVNVSDASDSQLLYQNNFSQQTFYAADGSSITFGILSDGTLGQEITNSAGQVTFKLSGSTWFWYDSSGNNIMQVGLLPDGSYGWAVATPGNSVNEAFGE